MTLLLVSRNYFMVYSNALYFASHFDKLTEEVLSTLNEKQKLQRNIGLHKIPLVKSLFALRKKGDSEKLD